MEDPDTRRLQAALRRLGYDAPLRDIETAWERRSEDWAAGWLHIPATREGEDASARYLIEHDYLVAV